MQYMNKQIKKILIVLLCLVWVIGIGVIRYIHYQNSAIVICIDAGHGGYDTGAIAADECCVIALHDFKTNLII